MGGRTTYGARTAGFRWPWACALVLAAAILLSLVVPHAATASTASPPASPMVEIGAGGRSADAADHSLVRHTCCASCPCHVNMTSSTAPALAVRDSVGAAHEVLAGEQPRPSPASIPFKPPRA